MSFNILLRDININQHILCEASAGTGKTFTIEHLFVRRLITAPRRSVREIAVLTFTNAVASELVLRLKRALDKAIEDLRTKNEGAADYILAVIEQGTHVEAANALEIARDDIEFAAIDTIHGFCYRCLTEYATGVLKGDKSAFATGADVRYCIEEFFREGLSNDICSQAELQVLLKKHKRDFSNLLEALSTSLWNDAKREVRSVDVLAKCLEAIPCEYTYEEIVQGLLDATQHFNGIRSKDGELKEGLAEAIEAFATLAIKPIQDETIALLIKKPLFASERFSAPKAKSTGAVFPVVVFARQVESILMELAHPDCVFERLRLACKTFVSRELKQRGLYCLQELLIRMEQDIQDSGFRNYLKKRFSCVIVDEFQDTDPHQWNIIQTLFVQNWHGSLYLVGDPKQAIYSFRQADVYCYMQAKMLENQAVVSLSKNFRSSPDLVSGLNTLFCGPHSPQLFMLPKLDISLDVPTILSGEKAQNLDSSGRGAIHFFVGSAFQERKIKWPTEELETDCFFSFIAQELKSLKDQGIAYSRSSILVKDRYQAQSVESYLELRGIPAVSWRKKSIIGSSAYLFLERILACCQSIRDRRVLVELLLHEPFMYSSESCHKLHEDLEFWAEHVAYLAMLRKKYDEASLPGLVHAFLYGVWPTEQKAAKELLWNDKEFLFDLEKLVEECQAHARTLEGLQEYLHLLKSAVQADQDQLMSRYDPHKEAVQILTLHASKGLEFDVVFGLGLANRTQASEPHQDPQEVDCEKLRQFYVACTRAKLRLYLPVAIALDAKEVKAGMKAPMELFLETIKHPNPVTWLLEQSGGKITSEAVVPSSDAFPLEKAPQEYRKALILAPLAYQSPEYILTSYTKLNEKNMVATSLQIENSLPAGVETGILLHEMIREMLQGDMAPDDSFIARRLVATALEGFELEVKELLRQALSVKLGTFCLADVERAKCFVEAPFYSKLEGNKYVHGAVDLFFEHKNKFYLLDWKSNALESYGKAALQHEIAAQGYGLQAKIYTQAALRYLAGSRAKFGGFYFVFLRGLQDKDTQGVYFIEPAGDYSYA